ncbi:hypothetical protein GCM10009844_34440 [Nocardioides koreensis]|uniref:DUF4307 domain-containing protein n=1 Tax=Nocardioides koreensis TaxID=433651 RepID=A0ABP5LUM2_9ACTN
MTHAGEPAAGEKRTSAAGARWPARRIAAAAVVGLLLVLAGYLIGVRSPWTAHHPHLVSGQAERVPADVPSGYFDPEDGDRVAFRLDDVVWRSGGRTGEGSVPPCLREEGRRVAVHVGLLEVARPFGSGSYGQVLSLTCPPG